MPRNNQQLQSTRLPSRAVIALNYGNSNSSTESRNILDTELGIEVWDILRGYSVEIHSSLKIYRDADVETIQVERNGNDFYQDNKYLIEMLYRVLSLEEVSRAIGSRYNQNARHMLHSFMQRYRFDLDRENGSPRIGAGPEYVGAYFERANLREYNLREYNLSRANLREANLTGANLRRADLTGADLRGANLRGADLRGADLRRADLRGAELEGNRHWLVVILDEHTQLDWDRYGVEIILQNLLQIDINVGMCVAEESSNLQVARNRALSYISLIISKMYSIEKLRRLREGIRRFLWLQPERSFFGRFFQSSREETALSIIGSCIETLECFEYHNMLQFLVDIISDPQNREKINILNEINRDFIELIKVICPTINHIDDMSRVLDKQREILNQIQYLDFDNADLERRMRDFFELLNQEVRNDVESLQQWQQYLDQNSGANSVEAKSNLINIARRKITYPGQKNASSLLLVRFKCEEYREDVGRYFPVQNERLNSESDSGQREVPLHMCSR